MTNPAHLRKPRTLMALLAAAAIAGTLSAGQASAASVATWDKVAACESGGDWTIVSRNNLYYGGLQITMDNWNSYGGTAYAARPDLATKQQQILIAEKILARQGPRAWTCSPGTGLATDHANPYPTAPAPVIKSSAVGVFRDGTWALRNASGGTTTAGFGQAGDIPITGDWDGYGHDQLGVFRPSTNTFALRHDDGSSTSLEFGNPGDIPVPGMWDHNGHAQMAVYRPSTNTFTVRHDNGSTDSVTLGNPGDIPIVGDWDGVGHTQMGVFRSAATDSDQNTFALRHDDGSVTTASYGNKGDLPIVGDWAGKGRTSFGVYRPSTATFALNNAYAGTADAVTTYGNPGDTPVTGNWN
ncbi:transglycosylase family protein [Streptomyces sp. NPDC059525]